MMIFVDMLAYSILGGVFIAASNTGHEAAFRAVAVIALVCYVTLYGV